MVQRAELVGQKFHRLTVLAHSHRTPDRVHHWVCQCECGGKSIVSGKNLRNANTKSCGCVHGIPISDPIELAQLLRLLSYDVQTGDFRWLVKGRQFKAGELAGYTSYANPYVRIGLGKQSYLAHRLAWFYMTGTWPEFEIDHWDTVESNNAWDNLRKATRGQNAGNLKLNVRNKWGYKGVSFRHGRFRATIAGRDIGLFKTLIEAAKAYDKEAISRFGAFARTNFEVP